jgi:hypothetical protein
LAQIGGNRARPSGRSAGEKLRKRKPVYTDENGACICQPLSVGIPSRHISMRPRVAVATVQGKAYFFIVNELKRRNIHFLSLIPGDSFPMEIRVVITTQTEKPLITHSKILVYDPKTDPAGLGSEVVKVLRGKEKYEKIIIGVDPGEVFGVAVIADGAVVDAENCFSTQETSNYIKSTLKTVDFSGTTVTVKVGSGVPVFRDLLEVLDDELPSEVSLEIVGEAGTNRYIREVKNRRGLRHMVSATRIARRPGHVYPRRNLLEGDS